MSSFLLGREASAQESSEMWGEKKSFYNNGFHSGICGDLKRYSLYNTCTGSDCTCLFVIPFIFAEE